MHHQAEIGFMNSMQVKGESAIMASIVANLGKNGRVFLMTMPYEDFYKMKPVGMKK